MHLPPICRYYWDASDIQVAKSSPFAVADILSSLVQAKWIYEYVKLGSIIKCIAIFVGNKHVNDLLYARVLLANSEKLVVASSRDNWQQDEDDHHFLNDHFGQFINI